ncbi:MAG: DegT/DnrJ/EryC1/StrS family aminotransferase [Desulfarculaceae bacterium]|nr:DegT/DnrJ/EryC1/StrS family aminotransferase [Desulfarculaceae bacterium]
MQFIDLAAQQKRIRKKIEQNLKRVLDHGAYVMGPEVDELEQRLAGMAGVKHALGCASGTDALLLALMALGIGPGDAVLVPSFTFFASAETVSLVGAVPVFVDISSEDFNLDPVKLERAVVALRKNDPRLHPLPELGGGPLKPKAVIAVDLYGLPADYAAINRIADNEGLTVIEDAAQSLGGSRQGKAAGSLGAVGCTSFYPAKPLGAYGEAGMVFTDDDDLAGTMTSLRVHGSGHHSYEHLYIGLNARMDTMQGAVLLAKLVIFSEELELRAQAAARYTELLAESQVETPALPEGCASAWAQYTVLAKDHEHRAALRDKLAEADVPTAVHYPAPVHLQPVYEHLGYRQGDFPVAEFTAGRVFSLPMHPYLKPADQKKIAGLLQKG